MNACLSQIMHSHINKGLFLFPVIYSNIYLLGQVHGILKEEMNNYKYKEFDVEIV